MYLQVHDTCQDKRILSCVCRSISVPGLVSRIQWGIVNRKSTSDKLQKVVRYNKCAPPNVASNGGSHPQTVVGGLLGERLLTGNHWRTPAQGAGVPLPDVF
jgi:hypothetical protein